MMSQTVLSQSGRAAIGVVEALLILHGGLNLVAPTALGDTMRAFAVCAAVLAAVLLVGARLGWVRRAGS